MQEKDFYQRLLALPDLEVDRVEYAPKQITLYCHINTPHQTCPHCLQPATLVNQYTQRQLRDLDISGQQVWLHIKTRQFVCLVCNRFFSERIAFADPAKSYTHRQAKWILDCCARQPFTQVAALLDMTPKTVERLYYHQVQTRLDLPARYACVRRLGIDEIAHRKGKATYCCVLTDLDKGIALDLLPSRSKEALLAHFKRLGPDFCAQIESVSFDMWPAYSAVSTHCFPQAIQVIDRFHVVKALNEVLDEIRRSLRRQYPFLDAFKDIKWALFKRQPTPDQHRQLAHAFGYSSLLKAVSDLRHGFHHQFDVAPDAASLGLGLTNWLEQARSLNAAVLDPFIKTLTRWLTPIANYAHQRLTNAVTEGLNNVIRYMKRISYGLPNFEHLRLRVLAQAM
jgi:transposase